MANGKAHDRAILFTAPLWLLVPDPMMGATGAIAHLVGGLYLSPDLDMNLGNTSRPLKRWGPFVFVWHFYRIAIPHRGISHVIILGTCTRLLNLAVMAALLAVPAIVIAPSMVSWMAIALLSIDPVAAAIVLAGLESSALVHLVLDR